MAYRVKKIDHEAVKRQLQSGVYDNAPKASMGGTNVNAQKLADFKNYLKTDQGQTNFKNQLANSSYVQGNLAKLNQSKQPVAPVAQQSTPVMAQGIQGGQSNAQSNAQSYIDQLSNARLQQTLASLDKSRDASLSNLQAEKAGIQPRYYDQRNQAAAGSQQQARNFAEFMAARGGTSGGANAQAEISRRGMLQGNLGSLGRQEAQAYTDIGRRTTDVENAHQSDIAGAKAGIEGDRMQNLLSDYYRAQDRGDRLAQQAIMNEINKAQLTGQYNGQQTQQAQNQQFNQSMATNQFGAQEQQRGLDNRYRQDSFEYTKAQNDWENAFREGQFDFQKAQQVWDNNFQNKSFQQGINEFSQSMGLNYSQLNQRQQEFIAEQAYRSEAMDLNQAQFKHTQMQDAVNTGLQRIANESKANEGPKLSATEINNKIQSNYVGKIDQIPENQLSGFFATERSAIINDMGISGRSEDVV